MNTNTTPSEMSNETPVANAELLFENEFGQVYRVCKEVVLVKATGAYIPIEDFKELFNQTSKSIEQYQFKKLIFDKRNLKVFHQPSMVWYFVEWKEKMYDLGLVTHRKILPKDPVFRECVKLGRENLAKENPSARYHEMDIQYRFTVEEAIAD